MEVSGFVEQVLFVVVLYRQRFQETKAFESLRPLIEKNPGAEPHRSTWERRGYELKRSNAANPKCSAD